MAVAEQRIAGIKTGLRCVVTAGAGGIGRAIANGLIAHGARVIVSDIGEAALGDFSTTHPEHRAVHADAGSEAGMGQLFDAVRKDFGGLDLLVNNAGIAGPTAAVEDISTEAWRETVDVNMTGHFLALREAVPLLKQGSDGAIVMISSVAGRLGYAYRLPYAATKWAVVGMAKSLAIELGGHGIRVNAILPGIVEGPRIDGVIRARAETLGLSFEEMRERYLEKTSLKRMVTADDIANMVLFLVSPLGRNVTGQALSVCGDVWSV
jgi:NAD(P)-dependent dehydrogenase (short-subunit alcohol dehydrogenase family)